uniref:Uncharacterized protein n=1 Tax=Anguilla anguilla TaxID=7936 RepID=A0A0E9RL12_ANGAN
MFCKFNSLVNLTLCVLLSEFASLIFRALENTEDTKLPLKSSLNPQAHHI